MRIDWFNRFLLVVAVAFSLAACSSDDDGDGVQGGGTNANMNVVDGDEAVVLGVDGDVPLLPPLLPHCLFSDFSHTLEIYSGFTYWFISDFIYYFISLCGYSTVTRCKYKQSFDIADFYRHKISEKF